LAHEEWHVRHGADEAGAYDTQLMALLSVGVDFGSGLYYKVRKSKEAVLAAVQRASKATVTLSDPDDASARGRRAARDAP
jgi:hypothetical protein